MPNRFDRPRKSEEGKVKKEKEKTNSQIRHGGCPCSYKVDRDCNIAKSGETGAGSDYASLMHHFW